MCFNEMKIDMNKAYDKIEWDLKMHILRKLGFNAN